MVMMVNLRLPNFVAIFRFFKMTAVRHLGFMVRMFRQPTNGIWWSLLMCKIWLQSICTVSQKTSHHWLAITLTHMNGF